VAFVSRAASTSVMPRRGACDESEQDLIRFREQAQDALVFAGNATHPIDINAWLLIAEDWLNLARAVEAARRNNLSRGSEH